MTSILDIGEGGVDPQVEVKKLQELVKKLETQNEVLRRKQKLTNETNVNGERQSLNNSVFYNTRKHSENIPEKRDSTSSDPLDTIDLIDIDKSLSECEDSWLYKSPRPATPQQTKVSPYKWVRQDLDHPSPELQSAKKSLKFKLDEVARMSRSSSTPAFSNYSTPPRGNPASMSLSADSTPSPRIMKPSTSRVPKDLSASTTGSPVSRLQAASRINTGTFTRPKKNKDKPSPDENNADDMKENVEQPKQYPKVEDIENLAKLQEESLRQSIAQTSPRREGMNRRNSHQSNNSLESDHSSPPDSPYGSSQQLHPPNGGRSNLRGSLPNVSRLVPHTQHHASDSSLADHQYEDHYSSPDTRYNRVPKSQPRPASPSVSGLKQPQRNIRGMSPNRTGLPMPRSSIPKPGSARGTGLPTPRRSAIPSPRPNNNYNSNQVPTDNSWREGCF